MDKNNVSVSPFSDSQRMFTLHLWKLPNSRNRQAYFANRRFRELCYITSRLWNIYARMFFTVYFALRRTPHEISLVAFTEVQDGW